MAEQDGPSRRSRMGEPGLCRTCHWRRVFETHNAHLQAMEEIEEAKVMVDMAWESAWQQLHTQLAAAEEEEEIDDDDDDDDDDEVSQQDLRFRRLLLLVQQKEALLAHCQRNELATRHLSFATDAHFKSRWGAVLPHDLELFSQWAEIRGLARLHSCLPWASASTSFS